MLRHDEARRQPGSKRNTCGSNYPKDADVAQPRRLPPFAKNLRPRADRSLIVVVGRRGWELFDRKGIDYGILLPDPDPALYRWPDLRGWPDGLIVDADGTMTAGDEREIALALLTARLPYVIGLFSSYKGGYAV